uniref:Peptidase S1 domain-containing protein n=1 Tax=Parastrongyloides trichosuri TaxID=131310 RepID=A0A0N4ZGN6_PARTI
MKLCKWLVWSLFFCLFISNIIISQKKSVIFKFGYYHKKQTFKEEIYLDNLENYKEVSKRLPHINLVNPLKVYKFKIKYLEPINENLCGIKFKIYAKDEYYNVVWPSTNQKNRIYKNFYKKDDISCSTSECSLGLFYFDKTLNGELLKNETKNHTVEYGVYVVLESKNNRFSFATIFYHKKNIRIGICPYEGYIFDGGDTEYTISSNIKDNGYYENDDVKESKHSILTPIYPIGDNRVFFVCGTLKQPMLPVLELGYSIKEKPVTVPYEKDVNSLKSDFVCSTIKEINKLYHFGLSNINNNGMKGMFIEKIDVKSSKNYKLYSGQTILMYSMDQVIKKILYSVSIGAGDRIIDVEPTCIRKLVSSIKATIIPVIDTLRSVNHDVIEKRYYTFIKEKDKKYSIKCLSIVEDDDNYNYVQFYSRAAFISVRKYQEDNRIGSKDIENILPTEDMKVFGVYTCVVKKKTEFYNTPLIEIGHIYILPDEGLHFNLDNIDVDYKIENQVGCIMEYDAWSRLISMNISWGFPNISSIFIDDFLDSNISKIHNRVIYEKDFIKTNITVLCEYETIVDSIFTTKQQFRYARYTNKELDENKQSESPSLFFLTASGFIILIIVATNIFVVVKRKRKRKEVNFLKSVSRVSSTSISKSESKFKTGTIARPNFSFKTGKIMNRKNSYL